MFLFLSFTETYEITSGLIPGSGLLMVLGLLIAGSYSKELYDYYDQGEQYRNTIISVSAACSGIASSFALLIPKIMYLESNHLDSVKAKFGIKITRIWTPEEYLAYTNEYLLSRKLPASFLSLKERTDLVPNSTSMTSLKDSLDKLVESRLKPSNGSSFSDLFFGLLNWCADHPQAVVVGATVLTTIAGYFAYNSGMLNQLYKNLTLSASVHDKQASVNAATAESLEAVKNNTNALDAAVKALNAKVTSQDELIASLPLLGESELKGIKLFLIGVQKGRIHFCNCKNSVTGASRTMVPGFGRSASKAATLSDYTTNVD